MSCNARKTRPSCNSTQDVQPDIFETVEFTGKKKGFTGEKKGEHSPTETCQTYLLTDINQIEHQNVSDKYNFQFHEITESDSQQQTKHISSNYSFIMYLICFVIIFIVIYCYFYSPTNIADMNPQYIFFPLITLFFLFYTK